VRLLADFASGRNWLGDFAPVAQGIEHRLLNEITLSDNSGLFFEKHRKSTGQTGLQ
jgi:hypothetical protein